MEEVEITFPPRHTMTVRITNDATGEVTEIRANAGIVCLEGDEKGFGTAWGSLPEQRRMVVAALSGLRKAGVLEMEGPFPARRPAPSGC